ncbi:MAG: ATP-binding protein [Aeromicrobium sp.]|uniref:ATP-binding protein n=1 Tax=Aeromicrobium sp. TaxID=1871063 RepID=UPI0025BE8967|nr:ATP-binding protein [Aeromicrobium sp.]MCK5892506.1 ATP-binding protein [Aeromicrobium sp.]MDF1703990.1 ATP-binding protein [Aeromicrobium sp.]
MAATGTTQLPFSSRSLRTARHELMTFLAQHGVRTVVANDALLVLGELAANAVRHGAPRDDGTFEARWVLRDEILVLSVHDGGDSGTVHVLHVDESAVSGRGLAIVDLLADRWWIERDSGTRISAELTV